MPQIAINLMVTQVLGVSSESEVDEISGLFYDFVDGCLSVPINFPGFAYYRAMKVIFDFIIFFLHIICNLPLFFSLY